ncbi:MAG: ATP-binding protein [Chloroflexota bacterium]|nr:ATP-binding protein [Chloroflexota bacterium]
MFRELGELLVGRDSTALTELVKNSYDADATHVTVYAESLDDPERGVIVITDDGNGMSDEEFRSGFLRIAGRSKREFSRRSLRFERQYTGEKGIGRLAAHKLARSIHILSIPRDQNSSGIDATIDWDRIEAVATLDEVASSGAITISAIPRRPEQASGTQITLNRLRRRWTDRERTRFVGEVNSAAPPDVLTQPIDKSLCSFKPLFGAPLVRDSSRPDKGMTVALEGDFAVGDEYWRTLVENASWIIDIDASSADGTIRVRNLPTRQLERDYREVRPVDSSWQLPLDEDRPRFQARLLVRVGAADAPAATRRWLDGVSGVRVFMEGFRVLPYGEPGNDWLLLDLESTRRQRSLGRLSDLAGLDTDVLVQNVQENEGLLTLPNRQMLGGVFLTENNASALRMLVNREGFVPGPSLDAVESIVRTAIDLNTRARQALRSAEADRALRDVDEKSQGSGEARLDEIYLTGVRAATTALNDAAANLDGGEVEQAKDDVQRASDALQEAGEAERERLNRWAAILVLASSGLQLAAFTHEIAGLVGVVQGLDSRLAKLRKRSDLPTVEAGALGQIALSLADVRQGLERQASYLVDIASADARRRRSRQRMRTVFEAACELLQPSIDALGISVRNRIDPEHRSLPMFRAELVSIWLNLLTNAIKAAGQGGRIVARSQTVRRDDREALLVSLQNTGESVDIDEAERWFLPFQTTTDRVDPVLGQGMGLGLPITRGLLEEYSGTIQFAKPRGRYATHVEFTLPTRARG